MMKHWTLVFDVCARHAEIRQNIFPAAPLLRLTPNCGVASKNIVVLCVIVFVIIVVVSSTCHPECIRPWHQTPLRESPTHVLFITIIYTMFYD